MVQKREIASVDPGAKRHFNLEWLELLAYANGCCVLHAEETVTVVLAGETDTDAAPDDDPGVLH